ncbi:MAG: Wzz/FepE/Etk N-terminal domain-containing protein [Hyphomonadaceae bacterium]
MSVETWSERGAQRSPAAQAGGGARVKPVLSAAEVLLQMWRSKLLMLLVFVPVLLVSVAVALTMETKYTSNTRLLVRLGPEYVFDPVVGDAARGAFPQAEEMVQSEVELARSPVILERVISEIGLGRLYPKLAQRRETASEEKARVIDRLALEAFVKNLGVGAAPRSSIIRMSFQHRDPETATETLKAFVDAYMSYRSEVLQGSEAQELSSQRSLIEEKLAKADQALGDFLARNGLSDFEAEQAAVVALHGQLSQDLSDADAALSEARGRVSALTGLLAQTPRTIELYVDDAASQTLAELRLEREQLLARYKPESRAVQDIEKRIAQVEAGAKGQAGQGMKRIGPNPTHQTIEGDLAKARTDVTALTARQADLQRQIAAAGARRARLLSLEADYGKLARDRAALQDAAGKFASREQAEHARVEMSGRDAGTITIYEAPRRPAKGHSPKRLIVLAGAMLGLLTALAAALLRAWSVPSFPTPGSLERTLGMPVLASVRDR